VKVTGLSIGATRPEKGQRIHEFFYKIVIFVCVWMLVIHKFTGEVLTGRRVNTSKILKIG